MTVRLPSRELQSSRSFKTPDSSRFKPLEGRVRACQPGAVNWCSARKTRDPRASSCPPSENPQGKRAGKGGEHMQPEASMIQVMGPRSGQVEGELELQVAEESARKMEKGLENVSGDDAVP